MRLLEAHRTFVSAWLDCKTNGGRTVFRKSTLYIQLRSRCSAPSCSPLTTVSDTYSPTPRIKESFSGRLQATNSTPRLSTKDDSGCVLMSKDRKSTRLNSSHLGISSA